MSCGVDITRDARCIRRGPTLRIERAAAFQRLIRVYCSKQTDSQASASQRRNQRLRKCVSPKQKVKNFEELEGLLSWGSMPGVDDLEEGDELEDGLEMHVLDRDGPPKEPPSSAGEVRDQFDKEPIKESESKGEILMSILQSGENIESKIVEYRDSIDEEMLQILEKRIEVMAEEEGTPQILETLELIWRRLAAELDRKQASPAMRLLDDVLDILAEGHGGPAEGEAQAGVAVAAKLRASFGLVVKTEGDIFSLAQKIAEGGLKTVEDVTGEQVDSTQFMSEASQLLNVASQGHSEMLEQQRGLQPDTEEFAELNSIIEARSEALEALENVLNIARQIRKELNLV